MSDNCKSGTYREAALERGRPTDPCDCPCDCPLHTYEGDEKCIWCRNADHARERPEYWPETFTDPSLDCDHAFTWDKAEWAYLCMYCGDRRKIPPESSIRAQRRRNDRSDDTDSDQSGGDHDV